MSPEELKAYTDQIDMISGGRFNAFATGGTPSVDYSGATYTGPGTPETTSYNALTPDQIKALGGLGATRTAEVTRAREDAIRQITADPNLTLAQRQRSTQLTNLDQQARQDAINKEVEAGITGLAGQEAQRTYAANTTAADTRNTAASTEAQRLYEAARANAVGKYQADVTNAGLTKDDLALLAQMFFGGKGSTNTGYGTNTKTFDWGATGSYIPGKGFIA
jgi:hypothetical protein